MDVISFRTPGLGDQTYLLTHDGRGVLVDPQRDIGRFLDAAAERDVELRFVLETHLHNDYVSGAEQAALRTGAELVLPAAAAPAYRHTPAFHLEDLDGGGGLTLRPVHTPGHTPEHTSYLVLIDGEPVALFSGGSLLVASAGRPDLLGPERARSLARLQHRSLRRLAALPPGLALYPTHGEGSFCTATGAGRLTSTIGTELRDNPLLAVDDPEQFADTLLAAAMPIPAFYRHLGPANTLGVPPMPPVVVPDLDEPIGQAVDLRPRHVQARGMLPGSYGIELDDDFGSWTGWLVPRGEPITLVAEPGQDVTEAVTQLAQIGVDTVQGVVRDLGEAATQTYRLTDLPAFVELFRTGAQLLDVRMPGEREQLRLAGAVERFLPDLFTQGVPAELDPERPVLVACASGRRAAIAAGLLAREGYRPIVLTGAGVPDVAAALDQRN
ncbi:MBL fold metallo-hydrolase [Nonomuraea gerenzanensis]|uniref:Beta-lactamase domain protein n=1 Tax=Nonomuraea gerenzanensis TaxID=93944 RepID=A0A1M4EB05_9ACTN|nr:MBL fold metallo-hydrolase [Nonomuraea gerenzanensis]UBU18299.1 MBL fold metallo-hydrolase [Nonomuraea gerenzanensis]SBO96121.1 beta-lactamase domain protein [Nonomuraea gerenzanensis]